MSNKTGNTSGKDDFPGQTYHVSKNKEEENGKERIDGETAEENGGSEIIRKVIHFIRRSSEDVKSPEQQTSY